MATQYPLNFEITTCTSSVLPLFGFRSAQSTSLISQLVKQQHCLPSLRNFALFCLCCLVFSVAQADTLNDVIKQDDTLRILERDRQKALIESIRQSPDELKQSEATTIQSPILGETPCFDIKTIKLIGPNSGDFGWLMSGMESFKNACLGVKSLEALQTNLNNKLLKEGYVTSRVTLPDQQLASGDLQFQLNLGKVDSVRLDDIEEVDIFTLPWSTWRNAVPIAKGDILNIRDLDQGLEQLKRLPSQNVNFVIEPAESDNSSILVIKRKQERRLRGQLSVDNSGAESLGREQALLGITLDSPLGLSDQLTFSASSNLENSTPNNRNQSASIYYSIPFGYNTFSTSFGYSRFGQIVQGTTVQFLSSGYSQNAEAKWHRTLIRDSSSKIGIYGAVSTRRARSFIEDIELLVQQRRTTAAELGLTYSKKFQNASLDLDTSYRVGLPWFQAEPRYFDSTFSDQPTTRPKIWFGNIDFVMPISVFDIGINYSSRLRWQTTSKPALSIDQFSIGSRYSVRGFDGNIILQSESGYSLRNELSLYGFTLMSDQLYVAPYVALDVGHLWGPSVKGSRYTTLAGSAIGLRAQSKYLYLDVALGTPLYKPEGFETHSINPMFQLTFSI